MTVAKSYGAAGPPSVKIL